MNKLLSLLAVFIFSYSIAFTQGLNNNYPVDSTDIKNSFNLMGLEMYKFPITSSTKYYLNIILEEYKADTLCTSISSYESIKDYPAEYHFKDDYIVDTTTSFLRIYWYDKSDSLVHCQFRYGATATTFSYDTNQDEEFGYRAYDFSGIKFGEKKTILIRHSAVPTEQFRHCPAGKTLEQVVKKYDSVIAISIELIEIDE